MADTCGEVIKSMMLGAAGDRDQFAVLRSPYGRDDGFVDIGCGD